MTHIFKPGDRAYWMGGGWIELAENTERDSTIYPLLSKGSRATFTVEGRRYARGGHIVLLPINPYDPTDPNNPKEFRNPFIHEGRLVRIGDELANKTTGERLGKVNKLEIWESMGIPFVVLTSGQSWFIGGEDITFADSLPKKRVTYLWAVPVMMTNGTLSIEFRRMDEEDAKKIYCSIAVPGSEQEDEG